MLTRNTQGQLCLTRGDSTVAKAGKATAPWRRVKPRNAVPRTLHGPPLLAAPAGEGGQGGGVCAESKIPSIQIHRVDIERPAQMLFLFDFIDCRRQAIQQLLQRLPVGILEQ